MSSSFDDFKKKVDYETENLIDSNSWEQKKIYSSSPFLVMPESKFNIKYGALLPSLVCYIRKKGEQFGDSMGYNLSNCTIKVFIYNKDNHLVVRDTMEVTNSHLGEVTYKWKEFDLQQVGNYNCEIEVTDNVGKKFRLPDTTSRLQIIVS